jgi:hypothetical protein
MTSAVGDRFDAIFKQSATDPDPMVAVAAFTWQITTIIVGLPIVDRLRAHDCPMGGVKGISGDWFVSILVMLWFSPTSANKPENNDCRQQDLQRHHRVAPVQPHLKSSPSSFAGPAKMHSRLGSNV